VGTTTKILKPDLGFNAEDNKLDLLSSAIATQPAPRRPRQPVTIHPEIALAIFDRLLKDGVVNSRTQFVVGEDHLELNVVAQRLRQQGWVPRHPLDENGLPNRGKLVVSVVAGNRYRRSIMAPQTFVRISTIAAE